MAEAPLTWKAHGSSRCVGCSRLLALDPSRAVVEVDATDYTGARPGYSAARPVKVRRRWHQDCVEEFVRASADLSRQVEFDRMQASRAFVEAHGLACPASDGPGWCSMSTLPAGPLTCVNAVRARSCEVFHGCRRLRARGSGQGVPSTVVVSRLVEHEGWRLL